MSEALKHYAKQMEPNKWYTCHDLEPQTISDYPAYISVSTALSHLHGSMPTKIKRRQHVKSSVISSKVRYEYALNYDPRDDFRVIHENDVGMFPEEPVQTRRIQKGVQKSGFRTWVQELEDLPKGFEIIIRRT